MAAAQVVFPTPPLPPTNLNVGLRPGGRSAVLVAFERGIDARDSVLRRRDRRGTGALATFADLPQTPQQVGFEAVEFGLTHLVEVEAHLGRQQLFTEVG